MLELSRRITAFYQESQIFVLSKTYHEKSYVRKLGGYDGLTATIYLNAFYFLF